RRATREGLGREQDRRESLRGPAGNLSVHPGLHLPCLHYRPGGGRHDNPDEERWSREWYHQPETRGTLQAAPTRQKAWPVICATRDRTTKGGKGTRPGLV